MAYKLPNGSIVRNDPEQIRDNKKNILRHFQEAKVMGDFGIRVIDRLDEWQIPTGTFEYGDAIAVGPEGGPFVFYIYTRGNPDYWFDYGAISIVGPQGPQGKKGDQGEPGKSTRWYVGPNEPTGNIQEGDMWLRVNNDGMTNGFVYIYQNNTWALTTTIKGPQGPQGATGPMGPMGPQGIQGRDGKDGNPSPIIDIIAELPEGTVISDIYSPSSVATNAGILMPVGGVNHLFIIINGNWVDSGSWGQGGTRIYVGGEEVSEFDADTKLNKDTSTSDHNKIYAKLTNGTQAMIEVVQNTFRSNAIPRYDTTGRLTCANPSSAYHIANKQYVDGAIAAAHSESHHSMNLAFAKQSVAHTPSQFTIPLAFLYDQFKNLTWSLGHANISQTIMMPCEFYYLMGSSWTMASPFAWLDFYMLEKEDNNVRFGIKLSEAGTAAGHVECVGTLDDETKSVTFTGYIGESSTGAPLTQTKIMLILPPDININQ